MLKKRSRSLVRVPIKLVALNLDELVGQVKQARFCDRILEKANHSLVSPREEEKSGLNICLPETRRTSKQPANEKRSQQAEYRYYWKKSEKFRLFAVSNQTLTIS